MRRFSNSVRSIMIKNRLIDYKETYALDKTLEKQLKNSLNLSLLSSYGNRFSFWVYIFVSIFFIYLFLLYYLFLICLFLPFHYVSFFPIYLFLPYISAFCFCFLLDFVRFSQTMVLHSRGGITFMIQLFVTLISSFSVFFILDLVLGLDAFSGMQLEIIINIYNLFSNIFVFFNSTEQILNDLKNIASVLKINLSTYKLMLAKLQTTPTIKIKQVSGNSASLINP